MKKWNIDLQFCGKQYSYMPDWKTILILLTLFPLLVYLGFWQLHRAEQKEIWLAHLKQQQAMPPLAFLPWIRDHVDIQPDVLQQRYKFTRFKIKGRFDQRYFLLDNQILNGKTGFRIIQYFQLDNSDIAILIDRGWVQQNRQRSNWPVIDTPMQQLTLSASMYQVPSGLVLKQTELNKGWPKLIQTIDGGELAHLGPTHTLPIVLQLQDFEPGVLEFVPAKLPIQPSKHLGYAVQWFTMAMVLLISLFLMNLKRKQNNGQTNS